MMHGDEVASLWVLRWIGVAGTRRKVLDLACGAGRHARACAQRGYAVTAVDRDANALASLADVPRVETLIADLEGAPWPFAPASFDIVIITNYLHRPLFGSISASLREGGLLIYETFMIGNERYGRPSNPAFLLKPGELPAAFAGTLSVVAFEQGRVNDPKPAIVQRYCGVRIGDMPPGPEGLD
ncbi:MAG: class I SAM-dependent methyltransferase [Burkholderiales bacterium]